MTPRQARRERREAERKTKKLQLKKSRLAEKHPLAAVEEFPEIQPRWNPELEDEFPKEIQIRNNAMADRIALQAGLAIPPSGPSLTFRSVDDLRDQLLARRTVAGECDTIFPKAPETQLPGLPEPPTTPPPFVGAGHVRPAPPEKLLGNATDPGFVSQTKRSRAEVNRANAQLSTGPTSPTGKLASSGNSLKHGLASGQLIISGEDRAVFDSFLNDLLQEHQPATTAEELLIQQMAQSHWLTQRAIRYQNNCFTEEGVDQKQLVLFLRYQTTHQRAFYKALDTLLKVKKANRHTESGFVSQRTSPPVARNGFVSQDAPPISKNPQLVSQNTPHPTPTEAHNAKIQAA